MIAPIEAGAVARYGARMRFAAIRLLALLALLLMPLGTASAPAESAIQHHSAAAMPVEHCPDQQSNANVEGGTSDCAMPCSAALAVAESSPVASTPAPRLPMELAVERPLFGIALEIATPPPKLS